MAFLPSQNLKRSSVVLPARKKQKQMFLILAALVLVIFLVLYFEFFSKKSSAPATPESLAPGQENAAMAEIDKLDFDIFSNVKFQSLKIFGPDLDISGEKGRSNPFLPY